jgi:hypothetical protein
MDLSTLADLGDFVGGIAVLASLAYLALQIRQNTRSVRAASFQALVASISERIFTIAESPELAEIYFRGLRGEPPLSEQDTRRFALLLFGLIRLSSNAFVQYQAGLISKDQWRAFHSAAMVMLASRGGNVWWERSRPLFSEEFVSFVDAEIRQRVERAAQQGAAADAAQPGLSEAGSNLASDVDGAAGVGGAVPRS